MTVTRETLQRIMDQPGVLHPCHKTAWMATKYGAKGVIIEGSELGIFYAQGKETKVPKNMGKVRRRKK